MELENAMTDLQAYITAARQMEEVTGEPILAGGDDWSLGESGEILVWENPGACIAVPAALAIDILESRVWRAVRGWSTAITILADGIRVWHIGGSPVAHATDLPSTVAAIHKHWKATQP